MNSVNSKRGFSVVLAIVIVLVLAGLAVGGYFGYKYFFAVPESEPVAATTQEQPNSAVPAELAKLVNGKNADVVVVYKKDKNLAEFLNKLSKNAGMTDVDITGIQSAVGVMKSPDKAKNPMGAIMVGVEFANAEAATQAHTELTKLNTTDILTIEAQDKFLLFKEAADNFEGDINENPLVKIIDPAYADSQLILLADTTSSEEINSMMASVISGMVLYNSPVSTQEQAFIPTAKAQGLISIDDYPTKIADPAESAGGFISPGANPTKIADATGGDFDVTQLLQNNDPWEIFKERLYQFLAFAKTNSFYIKVTDGEIKMHLNVEFMNQDDIASVAKKFVYTTGLNTEEIAQKQSQETASGMTLNQQNMEVLEQVIPKINQNFAKSADKSFGLKLSKSDNNLVIDWNGKIGNLPIGLSKEESAAKSKDINRKAALNNIITAIETYNVDNEKYPQDSGCMEKLTMLAPYFQGQRLPEDPVGPQKFGDITCQNGYYYQYFGNDGYGVWAKVDDKKNGNTAWPIKTIADIANVKPGTGGEYYFVSEVSGSGGPVSESGLIGISTETGSIGQENSSKDTQISVKKIKRPASK